MTTDLEQKRRFCRAAALGGVLFAGLFSTLTLAEADMAGPLNEVTTHWLFHILQAPVFGLIVVALLALRRMYGADIGRIGRFGSGMALFGFGAGVVAGLVIPVIELGLGQDTSEGTLDAIAHLPEFMPYVFGTLLVGISIALSGALPRSRGIALAISAVAFFVLAGGGPDGLIRVVPAMMFGLGWAWLGLSALPPDTRASRQTALAN